MPERPRHHKRSEEYAEDRSRDGDASGHTHRPVCDSRGCNREPSQMDDGVSAADRRLEQKRQRDVTSSSHRDREHQGSSPPPRETSMYYSEEQYYGRQRTEALYNLRYIVTSRGLCQIMEVFVNLLIIICAGVTHSNNGGYRDLASLGGIYAYHFGGANAFTGAEAERVKSLDRQFNQLKRPPYAFAMAWGGVLMIYALATLALGIFRVTFRWPPVLLGEALLNLLISLGYIPALAFFFIKLQDTYSNPICTDREQMYKSKGHKGFECQFNGADIAGGLFGVLGVFVFIVGAVLAIRAFRSVQERKKQKTNLDNHL